MGKPNLKPYILGSSEVDVVISALKCLFTHYNQEFIAKHKNEFFIEQGNRAKVLLEEIESEVINSHTYTIPSSEIGLVFSALSCLSNYKRFEMTKNNDPQIRNEFFRVRNLIEGITSFEGL